MTFSKTAVGVQSLNLSRIELNSKSNVTCFFDAGDAITEFENKNKYFASIATDCNYNEHNVNAVIAEGATKCRNEQVHKVSEYDIYHQLLNMKKTAPGPDEIPYWVFRECAGALHLVVAHLVNLSLSMGKVPSAWKKAYITPVPKVKSKSEYTGYGDLRPISVTPILCRMTEKFVVKRFLWPALDNSLMEDQFAFKPTGSTTAALIQLVHSVCSMINQGSDYVRCLLVDYSKAFDTVDHEVLLRELGNLELELSIFKWIADFLTGRTQAVKVNGHIYDYIRINRSIVQGSGIGPFLYITLARTLKTISRLNALIKYADDKSLLVPQNSDCPMETEYASLVDWSAAMKLRINENKTKEIIFWKSDRTKNKHDIPLIPGIERIETTKLLGVILTSNLSWTPHINNILNICCQRFYLLNRLKHMSLCNTGLNLMFRSLVVSRLIYALPAFSGLVQQADRDRINALLREGKRWGLTQEDLDYDLLTTIADSSLRGKIDDNRHCLHHLLPSKKPKTNYDLKPRNQIFFKPMVHYQKLNDTFIYRTVFKPRFCSYRYFLCIGLYSIDYCADMIYLICNFSYL